MVESRLGAPPSSLGSRGRNPKGIFVIGSRPVVDLMPASFDSSKVIPRSRPGRARGAVCALGAKRR
jgi:hypothetical protein